MRTKSSVILGQGIQDLHSCAFLMKPIKCHCWYVCNLNQLNSSLCIFPLLAVLACYLFDVACCTDRLDGRLFSGEIFAGNLIGNGFKFLQFDSEI